MKKVVKSLTVVLAAAMVFSVMSGCGQKQTATQTKSTEQPDKKVKLVFSRNKDMSSATAKLTEEFTKKNPNIEVEYQETPASVDEAHNQYVTAMAAKSSTYDVFGLDCIWVPEFAASGWVMPLDDKAKKDNYLSGPIEGSTYKGKLYALPLYVDAGTLFYRKDIISQPPKTWDELIKVAKENKGKNGTKYGYLFQAKQYEGLVCDVLELIYSYGGKIIDDNGKVVINSNESLTGLKKFIELVQSGIAPEGVTSYIETDGQNVFTEGNSVMLRTWTGYYALAQAADSKVKDKVGVAPIPGATEGKPGQTVLGGRSLAISAYSKNQDAAWKFVEYAAGEEGQRLHTTLSARYPGLKSAYKDPEIIKAFPQITSFEQVFQNMKPRPVSPIYPAMSDVMQINFHKAITGVITPEQALKTIQSELEKLVK